MSGISWELALSEAVDQDEFYEISYPYHSPLPPIPLHWVGSPSPWLLLQPDPLTLSSRSCILWTKKLRKLQISKYPFPFIKLNFTVIRSLWSAEFYLEWKYSGDNRRRAHILTDPSVHTQHTYTIRYKDYNMFSKCHCVVLEKDFIGHCSNYLRAILSVLF